MSINTEEIEKIIGSEIASTQITVQGQDGKYQISMVSDFFTGMNAVKRQQAVYKVINPYIASGEMHAVSMQLLSEGEFAEG